MSAISRRKQPGFLEGVVVALLLSLAGAGSVYMGSWIAPFGSMAWWLVSGLALGYVLYLLSRTATKTGRVTVVALYVAMSLATWFIGLPLEMFMIVQISMIWLVRVLYRYQSLLCALLDATLIIISCLVTITVYLHTGSLFLSLWAFFLLQACHVAIPVDLKKTKYTPSSKGRFQQAQQTAEAALRQLSSSA